MLTFEKSFDDRENAFLYVYNTYREGKHASKQSQEKQSLVCAPARKAG